MRLGILLCLLLLLSGCAIQNSRAVLPSHRKEKKSKGATEQKSDLKKSGTKSVTENSAKSKIKVSSLKKVADSYLGIRYKYGGTTRKGIDCSGLIWRVFQDAGQRNFERTSSSELYKMGRSVSRSNLKHGDLCFFGPGRKVNHVGIYMGNNRFIHASSSKGVTYSSLDNVYWKPRIIGFRRVF